MNLNFNVDFHSSANTHKLPSSVFMDLPQPGDIGLDAMDLHRPDNDHLTYIFSPDLNPMDLLHHSDIFPDQPIGTPSTDDGEGSLLDRDYSPSPVPKLAPTPAADPPPPPPPAAAIPRQARLRRLKLPAAPTPPASRTTSTSSIPKNHTSESDYELRIAAGMALVKSGSLSIRAAAKKVRVSHETLRRRHQGASSRQEFHTQLMALTPAEEQNIENMLLVFKSYSNMLTSTFLCNLVNDFRRQKARSQAQKLPKDLGISWTSGFRRRHEVTSDIMAKSMNKDKSDGVRRSVVDQWFEDVEHGCVYYPDQQQQQNTALIPPNNMYNLVELGYYSDSNSKLNCIKRADAKTQDAVILFSAFETLSENGTLLPSQTVYRRSSSSRGDSNLTSRTGWANAEIFLSWLANVFEPATRPTTTAPPNEPQVRAIFMDPCPAVFDSQVLQFALDHHIVFFLFPVQSPYMLQPADAGVIAMLNQHLQQQQPSESDPTAKPRSSGEKALDRDWACSVTDTAKAALSPSHITAAWQNTGLSPLNPHIVSQNGAGNPSVYTSAAAAAVLSPGMPPPNTVSLAMVSSASNPSIASSSSVATNTSFTAAMLLKQRLQRAAAVTANLESISTHYKSSLDKYLSSRPPLYYEDGRRADAEDEECLRGIMDECWKRVEATVQRNVEGQNKIVDWVNEIMM